MNRDQRLAAAEATLHAALDRANDRYWRDADRDRESDKVYRTYNKTIDKINRDYPDARPATHR